MAILNTRDPVQGLIDFVVDAKPYHTKVLEVWVEYLYSDAINCIITDSTQSEISLTFDRAKKYCEYGWDMQTWGVLLSGLDTDELAQGSISYDDSGPKTITRSAAYQLYFDYLCDQWRWANNEGPNPVISLDATNKYRVFAVDGGIVLTEAVSYFDTIAANQYQFWYDPNNQILYRKNGSVWDIQPAHISSTHPETPVDQDLWVDVVDNTLHMYLGGSWEPVSDLYVSLSSPSVPPKYPAEWNSVWDMPECKPPHGETWAHAYITDVLQIEIIDV